MRSFKFENMWLQAEVLWSNLRGDGAPTSMKVRQVMCWPKS
jgi:hypothetical protein